MGLKFDLTDGAKEGGLRQKPISERGGWVGLFLFGMFLLMGGVLTAVFLVWPVARVIAAGSWVKTPCVVVTSEVKEHRSDDGATYSIDILYEYEFKGAKHRSNRYDFMAGSSSGYDGKKAVVDANPPGHKTACYVNPTKPEEAVLNRGFTVTMLFGLIPVVFVAIGAGGLIWMLRKRKRGALGEKAESSRWEPSDTRAEAGETGAVALKPTTTRQVRLITMIVVAVVGNGILVCVGFDMLGIGRVFLVPLALLGLGMIAGVVYFALAALNPQPTIMASARRVRLGEPLGVAWTMTGRTERIERLRVTLEGREEADRKQGDNKRTTSNVFARITVVDTEKASEIECGKALVTVPANSMHSFEAKNNRVVWKLQLRGEIRMWPDVKEEFKIVVDPGEIEGGQS